MFFRMTFLLVLASALLACSDSGRDQATPAPPPQKKVSAPQADQVLESVANVLSGYQAFSGRLPEKLTDLDSGGYMFDAAYLAGLLPEGAELYLQLDSEAGKTQMWLQRPGAELLHRSLATPGTETVADQSLAQLKEKWQVVARNGQVSQVRL